MHNNLNIYNILYYFYLFKFKVKNFLAIYLRIIYN